MMHILETIRFRRSVYVEYSDLKGYVLIGAKKIEELDGEGYVLCHKKSGARVLLIDNEDTNKVFSIAFRTPPSRRYGCGTYPGATRCCADRISFRPRTHL